MSATHRRFNHQARSDVAAARHSAWHLCVLAAVGMVALPAAAAGQAYDPDYGPEDDFTTGLPAIEARVWFDRGNDPLFDQGDRVRVYYRSSEDAYVAIFHIDTDGRTRLVFPSDPAQTHYVRGGRDYRALFGRSQYWYVDDEPGLGYFFIVASATPMDFTRIPYSSYERDWDLTRIGRDVQSDPFLAMDEYVEALVPDWRYGDYGLDYAEYSIDSRHEYPRFMCYECHGYRPYYSWNPYSYSCSTFRVVLWDDPYYYPPRYRGDRVVFVGRRPGTRPRYEFKERGDGDRGRGAVVQRRTGPQRTAQRRSNSGGRVTGPSSLQGSGGESVSHRPQPAVRNAGPASRRDAPDARPQVAPPRASTGDRTPRTTRPPVATRPSTRFRDSGGTTESRTPPRTERTRGSDPEASARPGGESRTPVVRGRRPTQERSRPQLERRRPLTRSDAQGRVRVPPATRSDRPSATPRTRPSTNSSARPRRPSGSGASATPRPRSSSGSVRAPSRGAPSSGSARVQPRPRSGSASVQPRPRSGSAPSARSRPPASRPAARRPTPKRKPGGGV